MMQLSREERLLHIGKMTNVRDLGGYETQEGYYTKSHKYVRSTCPSGISDDLKEQFGLTYLFIAHDLSMVKYISDKIGVLHLGHLVETGTTEEIFDNPIHPYTKSLLSAIPHPNPRVEKVRKSFTYDYKESGVDYTKGTEHLVDGTHYVLATDEEFEKWTKK